MIYFIYLLLVPVSLALTLLALILAPLMVLFKVEKEWWCDNHNYRAVGPVLPTWLNWFMTPDNTLDGDAGAIERNGKGYWAKVLWLWRNPLYSFALRYLTPEYKTSVKGDKTIKDGDNAKAGWCFVRANGLFQFAYVTDLGNGRCRMGNLGWNIRALVDDNVQPKPDPYQATFAFTPFRKSGFKK